MFCTDLVNNTEVTADNQTERTRISAHLGYVQVAFNTEIAVGRDGQYILYFVAISTKQGINWCL